MARLLGPDSNSRAVYRLVGGAWKSAAGATATVYADAAGTTLADIAAYNPAAPSTPGTAIGSAQVTVDAYSQLPLFWFPADGSDTVYVTVDGGPLTAYRAEVDARMDTLTTDVASAATAASAAQTTATSANTLASTHASRHAPGGADPLTGLTWTNFAASAIDGTSGTASLRTLGVGAQQAAAGNHSHGGGGSDTSVTNVTAYGATGDGTTDDYTAIANAIAATPLGGVVLFPATGAAAGGTTVYRVSSALQQKSGQVFRSNLSPGGVIVKLTDGASVTAVITSAAYATNATTSGGPVRVENLGVDGNKAGGATGHGILLMNYNSTVVGCNVSNTSGAGIVVSDKNSAGTTISNSLVETRIVNNKVSAPDLYGIWVLDTSSSGRITDGYCQNNIIANAGDTAVYIQRAAGWFIEDNHAYASLKSSFVLQNLWNTYVGFNETDGYAAGSTVGTYFGFNFDGLLTGRPSVIVGNICSANENLRTANSYIYYRIRNASSGLTTTTVFSDNTAHRDTTGGAASTDVSWQPNSGTLNVLMGMFNTDGASSAQTFGTPGTVNLYGPGSMTTKGDIAVTVSNGRQVRVPVGADGKVLTADSAATAGVSWQDPAGGGSFTASSVAPGGANDIYSDYGNRAANVVETMSRDAIDPTSGSPSPSAGTMALTYFTPDQTVTVSNLTSATRGTAQAGATLAKMALFSVAGDGTLTCIARTASDTTLWQGTQTAFTRAIADDGAASPGAISSVQLTRGQRYAFAVLHVGSSTAPTLAGKGGIAGLMSATPRRGGYVTAQTDIPATVAAATISGNTASGNYYYGRAA